MTYQIAICDDDKTELTYLSSLVKDWARRRGHTADLSVFESAEAFLFFYAEHNGCDILLLDIEMGGMNGIALAKKIRAENSTLQIVFITGFPDFIAQGYEVAALHYLMKPVDSEKLCEVLDRACKTLAKAERSVIFNIGGEAVRVPAGDILYAEAFAHTVAVKTTGTMLKIGLSISEAEKLLGEGFVRCHRSYLVSIKYIARISRTEITLDDGSVLPLARSASARVNQAFIHFYKGE